MVIRQSKIKERSHEELWQYRYENNKRAEEDAYVFTLLNVLNHEAGVAATFPRKPFTKASRVRLTELVILLREITTKLLLLPNAQAHPHQFMSPSAPIPDDHPAHNYRCHKEIARFNETLAEIRLTPWMDLNREGRGVEIREHVGLFRKEGDLPLSEKLTTGTALSIMEANAVFGLMIVNERGEMDSLRRCECGNWFLAVRSDQHSCSATCRQRKHASSDTFKRKRKEYRILAKTRSAKKMHPE